MPTVDLSLMLHFRFPLHDDDHRGKRSTKEKTVARRHGQPPNICIGTTGTARQQRGRTEATRKASERAGPPPFLFFAVRSIPPSPFFESLRSRIEADFRECDPRPRSPARSGRQAGPGCRSIRSTRRQVRIRNRTRKAAAAVHATDRRGKTG